MKKLSRLAVMLALVLALTRAAAAQIRRPPTSRRRGSIR